MGIVSEHTVEKIHYVDSSIFHYILKLKYSEMIH